MMRRKILPLLLFLAVILFPSVSRAQKNVDLVNSGQILFEGNMYYYLGKFSKAENLYLKVGRNDTNYAEVLRDLALTYTEDDEDSLCAQTCLRGIGLESQYKPDFYALLGLSLKEMEKYDSAIKVLDEGIALYPYSYILYYHKGMAYFKMKKYDEALAGFQQAIMLNPYHANSHFQMGKICAEQGRIVPAILSYEYYLMVEPGTERSQKVVSALEDLYTGDYEADPDMKLDPDDSRDKCFADVEELIGSQMALKPGYKNKTKINLKLVKQFQAMIEKLHYESGTNNWWMENYVPFFVAVQQNNYFVPYVSFTLYAVSGNNPTVAKSIKKNKSKIKAFATWAGKYIKEHLNHPASELFTDKEKLDVVFYDNHMIAGMGHSDANEKPIGEWYYFYGKGGHKLAYGKFDEKGKRTGEWTWYHDNGKVREKTTYVNGLREGKSEEFFPSGLLSFRGNYKADMLDGDFEAYGLHGGLTTKAQMKADKLDGPASAYYANGEKKADVNYLAGKISGEATYYTIDGKAYSKMNYLNGKLNGHGVNYYSSGQVQNEGEYKNDDLFGYWKVYWDNGKMMREGLYKDKGMREGMWKEYNRDGVVIGETMYKAGKRNGDTKVYDDDGKIYMHRVYAAGKLKKETFYDKKGKEVGAFNIPKQSVTVTEYHPDGSKAAQGDYYEGERDGEWKFYSSEGGWMTTKANYRHGELSGMRKEYYSNGKEKSELDFSHDERDGYLISYFSNGMLQSEGWFVKDERQGEWFYYNERGTMIAHRYFMNDEPLGFQEFYDNKGRKNEELEIKDGNVWTRTRYDSTGAVSYRYESDNGTGTYALKFPNGKDYISQPYKNGELEGLTTRYDYSGQPLVEVNFKNGEQHGTRKEYYKSGKLFIEANYAYDDEMGASNAWWENGNKRWEENYFSGDLDGTQKYYHENGQLRKESHWNLGTIEGELKYYSEDGLLQIIYYYTNGDLQGYSYNDKDGNPVPMIRLDGGSGKFTAYYQNGNKSMEGEYDNGNLTGKVIEYYSDGKTAEDENYEMGDLQGLQKYYYTDGTIKKELNYFLDQQDGTWTYYYPSGKPEHTEAYNLGDDFGTWVYYNEDGSEKKREVYYDDRQLSETIAPPPAAPVTPVKGKKK